MHFSLVYGIFVWADVLMNETPGLQAGQHSMSLHERCFSRFNVWLHTVLSWNGCHLEGDIKLLYAFQCSDIASEHAKCTHCLHSCLHAIRDAFELNIDKMLEGSQAPIKLSGLIHNTQISPDTLLSLILVCLVYVALQNCRKKCLS